MCDCISTINARLLDAGSNTKLTVPIVFRLDGAEAPDTVLIMTEKADKANRNKPAAITPTYCPFCAEKYLKD